jgi:hypothetical protein
MGHCNSGGKFLRVIAKRGRRFRAGLFHFNAGKSDFQANAGFPFSGVLILMIYSRIPPSAKVCGFAIFHPKQYEHRTQPFRRLGDFRYSARPPCAARLLWIFQANRRAIIQKGDSGKMRLETAFLTLLALHLWAVLAALLVAAI